MSGIMIELARGLGPWLRETRRAFHAEPELGNEETATQARIEAILSGLGLATRRVGTGVLAVLEGGAPRPVVAIRADIDALPVEELGDFPWKSRKPGLMHACGHDAHTTVALGVARLFAEHRELLPGTLSFLFQPDEEGDGGAVPLIAAGALREPPADAILGLHVMPYLDVGRVEVKKGVLNGSSATLTVTVRGKGSHGAYPDEGIDAILIAAQVTLALNQLVSRYVSPLDEAVLTVGTINGGQRSNIVASEVVMKATLRTTRDETCERLVARARALVEGIAAGYGGSGSLDVSYGYRALVNDDAAVDAVVRAASAVAGPAAVTWKDRPSLGVEDFSYYLKEIPGAFWHLGCGSGPAEARAPLHSGQFLLDEDCLAWGVAIQAQAALELMREGTRA